MTQEGRPADDAKNRRRMTQGEGRAYANRLDRRAGVGVQCAMPYYVYIMTNRQFGALYIGVTNDIGRRAFEHREGLVEGFTKKYGLKRLVHVEEFDRIVDAIHREKRLKHWKRAWKIALIEEHNPNWDDLYPTLL
jgi:putative endonuclease